nr:MAG TPA: hypothetical protein [Caudoviricetes sp.]
MFSFMVFPFSVVVFGVVPLVTCGRTRGLWRRSETRPARL